jgi:hypothetical protein
MDSSNSMRDVQNQAAAQVGMLVNRLLDGLRLYDVRVGVVTTDLGAGTYVIPSCGVRDGDAARLNPRVNGPSIATRTGILPEPPSPIFCPSVHSAPYMTFRASDNAMLRYWAPSCHTTVGVGGCGLEQPLESALRALTSASSPMSVNAGFVRPNAVLAVLDDQRDLRATAEEVGELGDHLASRAELDLAAQVLGALDQHLAHRGVRADALQQAEGLGRRSGARGACSAAPRSAAR